MPAAEVDAGGLRLSTVDREQMLRAFEFMVRARVLDEKLASLYRAGKIYGGVFLGRGQEALSVAGGVHLRPGDVFAPLIRDLAGRLAFGETVLDVVRTALGSPLGPMRGRDGNVHRGRPREGLLPMISHLGAMIAVTNGVLFARRHLGRPPGVGLASIGDGGMSTGACHEALNQAGVEHLPLVLVIANNQFAYSTPNSRQFACCKLIDRAAGYGFEAHEVDGTDLAACLQVMGRAISNAREGRGPQMVEAQLLRLCGHGEHDDAGYISEALRQSDMGRDCLARTEESLLHEGWVDRNRLTAMRHAIVEEIEAVVAQVQRESPPDPYAEDWRALSTRNLNELQPEESGNP